MRTGTPKLSEVAPGVFVGGWKEAQAFSGTRFCVLDEAPPEMPPATHVRIYDESTGLADLGGLERLARGMQQAHDRGEPVMVFCGHGVRRSPLGAAWYLRRAEGLSLDQAYVRVCAARSRAEHAREWVENAAELARA